jgi:8-oxo-dGTP diphosphatase
LLWRPSRKHGVKVALVHRARYDDWSLPKGKADDGETAPVTAAREVFEETGFGCAIGRALTSVSYEVSAGPKTVLYFAGRATGGSFTPNKEVDELEWLPIPAAAERMSYEYDRAVLDTFALEEPDLRSAVVVRHGRAGHRESFDGDDISRPLDGKGERQAEALAENLLPFLPAAVHSAPMRRCRETVQPLADRLGLKIADEPLLGEEAYRDDPAGARRRLVELVGNLGEVGSVVACSQGGVIPGVVKSLAGRADVTIGEAGTPKAAYWLLTFDGKRLVQADPYPAPSV